MKKLFLTLGMVIQKKEKKPLGDTYTYTKMNKYNPLTWIFIIIAVPIAIWQDGYKSMRHSAKHLFEWT